LAAVLRTAAVVGAGLVLVWVLWALLRTGDDEAPALRFEDALVAAAELSGARGDRLRADDPIRKVDDVFVRTWTMEVPDAAAADDLATDIRRLGRDFEGRVDEPEAEGREAWRVRVAFEGEAFDIRVRLRPEVTPTPRREPTPTATPRPQPPKEARGRLAILLDDAGQSMDLVERCAALPPQVGVAVLPFLPYSTATATAVHRAGHQVWLHLPMEPRGYPDNRPGPGAVFVSMDDAEVRRTVHSALNSVPHVVGVNNHMGSRATEDMRLMTVVMQELRGRGMWFIDSRTTTETVAEEAARAVGVPTGRRHVFLDNSRTESAISAQLAEAVYRARMDGEAVAIGHVAPPTLAVLERELPNLAQRGADLVPPGDLVR
jgi:polysaccharide deacetylase 2 family uncharacterized protein YibQ